MTPARIVSGGQSGVDRAALDFAIRHGIAYGGWCPRGGWAEDREEPPGLLADYPLLREAPAVDPAVRTELNVRDSDATLVLARAESVSAGTELTVRLAEGSGKPSLLVDPAGAGADRSVREFICGLPDGVRLNVAGPRESEAPGIYRETRALLEAALCPPEAPDQR
ncbi:MAG: putative molybdenum carrier protein [Solirubrobacterales bacterium]